MWANLLAELCYAVFLFELGKIFAHHQHHFQPQLACVSAQNFTFMWIWCAVYMYFSHHITRGKEMDGEMAKEWEWVRVDAGVWVWSVQGIKRKSEKELYAFLAWLSHSVATLVALLSIYIHTEIYILYTHTWFSFYQTPQTRDKFASFPLSSYCVCLVVHWMLVFFSFFFLFFIFYAPVPGIWKLV